MTVGLPIGNTNLFSATVSNRTITPTGPLPINDARQRVPAGNAAVTLSGSTEAARYDVYAVQAPSNTYTLLAVASGTNMSARRDLMRVGTAVEYPSLNAAYWLPLAGGALDPWVSVAPDGKVVRLGPSNAAAQQIRVDGFGRLNSTSAGATTFVLGTGAGTGATNNCVGTDQWGVISFVSGSSPVAGGILATVTFARPFAHAPYGVISYWFGSSLLASYINRNELTTTGFALRGGSNLSAGFTYEYMYIVLGGD